MAARTVTWTCRTKSEYTTGDKDTGGLGLLVTNTGAGRRSFYLYQNSCDTMPYKHIALDKGKSGFLSVPARFEGRLVRGTDKYNLGGTPQLLGTWMEFSLDAQNVMWGDVSLIRGCDGPCRMWGFDKTGKQNIQTGFTTDVFTDAFKEAPADAFVQKDSGAMVLKYTENNDLSLNVNVVNWLVYKKLLGLVYVDDSHGDPVISSQNGRFGVEWPEGRV